MTEQQLLDVLPTLALLDDASACQLRGALLTEFLLHEGYDALACALMSSIALGGGDPVCRPTTNA